MNDLNAVILEGNLTREPEVRQFADNTFACKFTIAVNRYIKKKNSDSFNESTAYFLIEAWGNIALTYVNELHTGTGIRVVGKLRQATWKDNGLYRERVYVLADHIELRTRSKKSGQSEEEPISPISDEFDASSEEVSKALDATAAEAKPEDIVEMVEQTEQTED